MTVNPIKRLFLPQYFIKEKDILGDIPSNKEMYSDTIKIATPAVLESLLISFMSMLDTIMVSGLGAGAVAAVNVSSQPQFIALALILALNMGVMSIIAHRKGQNNSKGANDVLKQSLVISTMLSLISAFLFYMISTPFLTFAGAGSDIIGDANTYFRILMMGLPFSAISSTISAAQRGAGYTRISMQINLVSNIVDLIFNYLLINGKFGFPALGVAGAALGSTLGYFAGFLMAIISVLIKNNFINVRGKDGWRFDKKIMQSLYNVVSGTFVEQICMRVGFLLYNKTVAELGTISFAAHSYVMQIANLSFSIGQGLGITSNSLVGQNLGANRPDLASIFGKLCQRISFIMCTFMVILFFFAGKPMLQILTTNTQIHTMGADLLKILGIVVYAQGSQMIYMGSLRGAGDTKYTAIVSFISITILRPGLAYILAYPLGLGLNGIWIGLCLEQYNRLAFTYFRFRSGRWKNAKL